ncbi:MAG: 30S ribosomal protein S13 [Elusimicrobia bacterium]|jgi:small subunit ribosomal protein S13|nr:30S ribosomal protein S13 [Elusimicrobiota bacterium]
MARIEGVNLPKDKKIKTALTYIYGIGDTTAVEVIEKSGVDEGKRVKELSDDEVGKIQKVLKEYKTEGELRREKREALSRLKAINSYRGYRHKRSLPVRGQRTKTNARTRKGPKK